MNTQSITNAFTHGGKFHADDVFSAALLTLLFPNIQIERGFTVPENFDGIVFGNDSYCDIFWQECA